MTLSHGGLEDMANFAEAFADRAICEASCFTIALGTRDQVSYCVLLYAAGSVESQVGGIVSVFG